VDTPQSAQWCGAFRIRDYLERSTDPGQVRPPEAAGVYVVTKLPWDRHPTMDSHVLYVGGNSMDGKQFRNRIGLLIKDMLGFWGDLTGSHSGGIRLHIYCKEHRVNPLDLYFGWIAIVPCGRCAEGYFFERLQPELCKKRPGRCNVHNPPALPFELPQ
jgi:hypothetical protein